MSNVQNFIQNDRPLISHKPSNDLRLATMDQWQHAQFLLVLTTLLELHIF